MAAKKQLWVLSGSDVPLRVKGEEVVLGPWFFTSKANGQKQIASYKDWVFPKDVSLEKMNTSDVIHSIQNRFYGSDLFSIDGSLFPVTLGGGEFLDKQDKEKTWGPLFKNPVEKDGFPMWLHMVLGGVSEILGNEIVFIDKTDGETEEKISAASIDKMKTNVQILVAPEPHDHIALGQGILDGISTFWVRTKGLAAFSQPELEMRHIPPLYCREATEQLAHWGALSLERGLEDGELLTTATPFPVSIRVMQSYDPHWEGNEAYTMAVEEVFFSETEEKKAENGGYLN